LCSGGGGGGGGGGGELDDSLRLDVEIAHVLGVLWSLFPSWSV